MHFWSLTAEAGGGLEVKSTVSYCLNRYEAQKTFPSRCLGKTLEYGRSLERK